MIVTRVFCRARCEAMLRFLGRESAFHSENNCGFFQLDGELVLMDCPLSAFNKIRHIGADVLAGGKADGITVLVTHTHTDHIGGIGMLIHYCCYVLGIPVRIVAPSREVAEDVRLLAHRLDGCSSTAYRIITPDEEDLGFNALPVATTHTEELADRCFGWVVDIGGRRFVYTGDTNTLGPFMPYLTKGCQLYTEASAFDSPVHLFVDKLADSVGELKKKDIQVFLMHLDNEEALAKAAERMGAVLAPLYGAR